MTLGTHISPEAEVITGDPLRLEQALQNLTANALRHTPAGGHVELLAEMQQSEIAITVHDTGSGIPPEHLEHVFDRFYKVDAARKALEILEDQRRPIL